MKLRINLRHGIWACFDHARRIVGCGHTPADAYAEWKAQLSSSPEALRT